MKRKTRSQSKKVVEKKIVEKKIVEKKTVEKKRKESESETETEEEIIDKKNTIPLVKKTIVSSAPTATKKPKTKKEEPTITTANTQKRKPEKELTSVPIPKRKTSQTKWKDKASDQINKWINDPEWNEKIERSWVKQANDFIKDAKETDIPFESENEYPKSVSRNFFGYTIDSKDLQSPKAEFCIKAKHGRTNCFLKFFETSLSTPEFEIFSNQSQKRKLSYKQKKIDPLNKEKSLKENDKAFQQWQLCKNRPSFARDYEAITVPSFLCELVGHYKIHPGYLFDYGCVLTPENEYFSYLAMKSIGITLFEYLTEKKSKNLKADMSMMFQLLFHTIPTCREKGIQSHNDAKLANVVCEKNIYDSFLYIELILPSRKKLFLKIPTQDGIKLHFIDFANTCYKFPLFNSEKDANDNKNVGKEERDILERYIIPETLENLSCFIDSYWINTFSDYSQCCYNRISIGNGDYSEEKNFILFQKAILSCCELKNGKFLNLKNLFDPQFQLYGGLYSNFEFQKKLDLLDIAKYLYGVKKQDIPQGEEIIIHDLSWWE